MALIAFDGTMGRKKLRSIDWSKKFIFGLLLVASCLSLNAQQAESKIEGGAKLQNLREAYRKRAVQVRLPIESKYDRALERLLDSYAKSGDLDSAVEVRKVIDSRSEQKALAAEREKKPLEEEKAMPLLSEAEKADFENGFEPSPSEKVAALEKMASKGERKIEIDDSQWSWVADDSSIHFHADGTATGFLPKATSKTRQYSWARIDNNTLSIRMEGGAVKGTIQILRDLDTAVYTNTFPSTFKRIINRKLSRP